MLAKTGFLGESPPLIREGRFSSRDAPQAYDERFGARLRGHEAKRRGHAGATRAPTSDAELGLEQIVDGLRIGLAAG